MTFEGKGKPTEQPAHKIKQSKNIQRIKYLAIGGIISPILLVIVTMVPTLLDPSYSPISMTISESQAIGAPHKPLVDAIMVVYDVSFIPVAIALHKGIRATGKLWEKIAPAALILVGVISVPLTLLFPLDIEALSGNISTPGSILHFNLAAVVASLMMLTPIAFWFRMRKDKRWYNYRTYSLASFAAVLILGILTFALAGHEGSASDGDYRGLLQRLTIGSVLQWQLVMAIGLIRLQKCTA